MPQVRVLEVGVLCPLGIVKNRMTWAHTLDSPCLSQDDVCLEPPRQWSNLKRAQVSSDFYQTQQSWTIFCKYETGLVCFAFIMQHLKKKSVRSRA